MAGEKYAQLSWSEAQAQFPAVKPSFLEIYLFTSAYFYTLLTHGYGFDPDKTPIHDPTHAPDAGVGAQLRALCGSMEPDHEGTSGDKATVVTVTVLIVVVVAGLVALGLYHRSSRRDELTDELAIGAGAGPSYERFPDEPQAP